MFKRKSTVKPNLPKEYVFTLDMDGEEKIYKVLVTETMCTTYEGDVECKHLKVMNPECREGVLQIDTVTSIYGQQIPFQLERFIPYIKLDGHWKMSDTTEADRLDETVQMHKKNSRNQIIVGIGCILASLILGWINGDMGEWSMLTVFGIFFITGAGMTRIRLKQELQALEDDKEAEAPKSEA